MTRAHRRAFLRSAADTPADLRSALWYEPLASEEIEAKGGPGKKNSPENERGPKETRIETTKVISSRHKGLGYGMGRSGVNSARYDKGRREKDAADHAYDAETKTEVIGGSELCGDNRRD